MAKIKVATTAAGTETSILTYLLDTTTLAVPTPTGTGVTFATAVTMAQAGSLSVAGVSAVTGSSGIDNVTLLGAFSASQANTKFGFSNAIAAVSTFAFDTKNTSTATIDSLTGSATAETITLSNTHIAVPTIGARVKYYAGSSTVGDTINGTALTDAITLTKASKITYDANTAAITTIEGTLIDTINGSGGNDNITLAGADGWSFKSGGGVDTLTGTSGATAAAGGVNGVDTITLTSASSIIYKDGGNTIASGTPAADSINGSSGNDTIKLDSSTTSLSYDTNGGLDTLTGTAEIDSITVTGATATQGIVLGYNPGSTTATDVITITAATADKLTFTAAADVSIAYSGGGSDSVIGSSSKDTITITAAAAITNTITIRGNGGADGSDISDTDIDGAVQFLYGSKNESGTSSTSRDTITGFDVTTDALVFDGVLSSEITNASVLAEGTNFTNQGSAEARFSDSTELLEIDIDGNGTADMSITLVGVLQADITGEATNSIFLI